MFKAWLHERKDRVASVVLSKAVRGQVNQYGELMNLQLDSRQKTFRLEVLLRGEKEPVVISAEQYEIIDEDASLSVVIRKASSSKEWVTLLLEQFLVGRKLPIPPQYARMAKMVL